MAQGIPKGKEAEIEKRRNTVAANLLAGLNYRDMAMALGVSIGTVANDVKIILGRWQREQVESLDEHIQIELRRIDTAINAIWNEVKAGKLGAIKALIDLQNQKARFLGIPARIEFTGKDGGPIQVEHNIEQIRAKRWQAIEGKLVALLQEQSQKIEVIDVEPEPVEKANAD